MPRTIYLRPTDRLQIPQGAFIQLAIPWSEKKWISEGYMYISHLRLPYHDWETVVM